MRRAAGNQLVPNEERVLVAASSLAAEGHKSFHGYLLAGELRRTKPDKRVMAYSTLYRCLDRLVERGFIAAAAPSDEAPSGGPPRKMFRLTPAGQVRTAELANTKRRDGLTW